MYRSKNPIMCSCPMTSTMELFRCDVSRFQSLQAWLFILRGLQCLAKIRFEAQVKSIWACVTLPQRYHFFLGLVPGLRCHLSTRLRWIGIQYPKLIASDASLQTPKEKQTIHQWLHDTIHSLNSCVNQIQKFPSVMDHFDDVMQNQQFSIQTISTSIDQCIILHLVHYPKDNK